MLNRILRRLWPFVLRSTYEKAGEFAADKQTIDYINFLRGQVNILRADRDWLAMRNRELADELGDPSKADAGWGFHKVSQLKGE